MSLQEYQNKLVGNGRVQLNLSTSNVFPFPGDEVTLTANTKWAQKVTFTKNADNEQEPDVVIDNTTQCAVTPFRRVDSD